MTIRIDYMRHNQPTMELSTKHRDMQLTTFWRYRYINKARKHTIAHRYNHTPIVIPKKARTDNIT